MCVSVVGKRRFINQTREHEAKRNAQPNIPSWGWLTRTNPLAHLHHPFLRVIMPSVLTFVGNDSLTRVCWLLVSSDSLIRVCWLLSAMTHSTECADFCQQWLIQQSVLTCVSSDSFNRVCWLLSAMTHFTEYADFSKQWLTHQSTLTFVSSDSWIQQSLLTFVSNDSF